MLSQMKKDLMLANMKVSTGREAPSRMANLLWGPAGAGKTAFAATAPGTKLWLSFGDQEHVSVMHRKDVHVLPLSEMTTPELFKHAQNDNPFGLDAFLSENEEFETVVCDSSTALAFRALQHAVSKGMGAGSGFTPSMEAPGIAAYGARNAIVLQVITGLLRVTAKHGVHIIITAHEGDPTMRQEGGKDVIDFIGMMLGGQLVNNMTWRLSEIWHLRQEAHGERQRKLCVRITQLRKPMKTRMFSNKGDPQFVLNYDADLPDNAPGQMTIAKWYDEWQKGGGNKLEIPRMAEKDKRKL